VGALDLAIIAAYLAAVVAAGAAFSRRQKTTKQYFTGGGRVPWWAVSASIVATETSAVTFLSIPGIAFAKNGNFTFLQLALGYVIGRVAISLCFIPMYFRGELSTVYQLLTARFGERVKGIAAALFVVMRTAADGIRLLLTASVLAAVWRAFDPEAPAETVAAGACVALGAVIILFTLWGGMEAVIWIEVAQLCVYLLGAGLAAWWLARGIPGGAGAAADLAAEYHKTSWLDFSLRFDSGGGYTFWSGVVGGAFLNMATHGTDQYLVQRYLCVGSPRKAARALLVSGIVVFAQFALFLGIGLLLFAYYKPFAAQGYAELKAGSPEPFAKTDAAFVDFITQQMPSGAAGFVVAAILAAALSSSLNSIAATVVTDLLRPARRAAGDAELLRWSKRVTMVAGLAQIAVAIAALRSQQSALEIVLTAAGIANGPILGIFLLGMVSRRAGPAAAAAGLVAGIAAALFAWRGTQLFWPWYTAVGAAATLAAGIAASAFVSVSHNSPIATMPGATPHSPDPARDRAAEVRG
jgi:SSS family transporter